MNVMLVGGEAAGLHTLNAVVRANHTLVAVLVAPSQNDFSGASLLASAQKQGVPTWAAARVRDPEFAGVVRASAVDLLLNVHSLYLVNPAVLEAPRLGCFNLHPGPLPECAGLNAPSWAIHHGERTHGVTLHWMSAAVDTGPIAYCDRFPIDASDTGLTLALKCVRAGLPLVEKLLQVAATDATAIPRITQNFAERRYFAAGPPSEGRLNWTGTARQIFDFVRACDYRPFQSPWNHPRTRGGDREFGIVASQLTGRRTSERPGTVGYASAAGVEVACGDEWLLVRDVEEAGRYERASVALFSIHSLS